MTTETKQKFWMGDVPKNDDLGRPITNEFIDGKTHIGPWATMNPASWREYGIGRFGTGLAQRYKKQADGRWLKVEG